MKLSITGLLSAAFGLLTASVVTPDNSVVVGACEHHSSHTQRDLSLLPDEDHEEEDLVFGCGFLEPTKEELDLGDEQVNAWVQEQILVQSGSLRRGLSVNRKLDYDSSPVKEVNIVFHIINATDDFFWHYDATHQMIVDQMDVLNAAFAPGKFHFNWIDTTYTTNNYWFAPRIAPLRRPEVWLNFTKEVGSVLRVGGPETMNVYLSWGVGGGIASYPSNYTKHPEADSIWQNYRFLPGYPFIYGTGLTLVHEVGHWLSLLHTFHNGCDLEAGVNGGDRVLDTNPEAKPAFGCPVGRDTCNGPPELDTGADPVQNYMDYSDCVNHFTAGQYKRMHEAWYAFRAPSDDRSDEGSDDSSDEDSGEESDE